MSELKLPDLGEGLQEAEIVEWMVQEGDTVEADQPLVSVETAKAVVEVPAPVSGVIEKLHFQEGDLVEVGALLVTFKGGDGVRDATPASPAKAAPRKDSGTVAGSLQESNEIVAEAEESLSARSEGGFKCTPAIRALARKLGIELNVVTPTGPNDTITRGDVERVHKILSEVEPIEELRGVRRAMAQTMVTARDEVMHATIMDEADITDWPEKSDVTIRIIHAIVHASQEEPALNGWFFPKETGRRLLKKVHLGIAMDTSDGLFVPVLQDVANRSPEDLRQGLNELKQHVRNRSVPPEQLRGHTFTLSNFGMFAGKYGTPVVVPPTMAILAAGRIHDGIRAVNGSPEIRRVLPLSLSIDHRAINGGEAARWLKAAMESLSKSS